MIIYGYRDATLQSCAFEEAVCPHCGQQGHIVGTVFSRHAHVMWIPLFPFSKRLVVWCQQCGQESGTPNFTPDMQMRMATFRSSQKARIWQYTGLLLFAVFMINMMLTGRREMANTKKYFESPAINDVYCTESDNEYSLMTIGEILDDSIYFYINEYYTSKITNVQKLHRVDFYEQDIMYGYSKEDLKDFYDKRTICKIWRNLPYSTEKVKVNDSVVKDSPHVDMETEEETQADEENSKEAGS